MGAFQLQPRCPRELRYVTLDPKPDWSFEELLSELSSLEEKIQTSFTVPLLQKSADVQPGKSAKRKMAAFVMRLSDDEMDDYESEGEGVPEGQIVVAKQFGGNELYLSEGENSNYELAHDAQPYLMDEVGLVEGSLYELSQEHLLGVKDEIRNQIVALELQLITQYEESASAFMRVEKYKEARRELEEKLDTQYQRKIAEALDDHLTAVQRNHELKSQMEERRLRSDAAFEEARRKEKALKEERLSQEKARAEAEAKRRAEEAKKAALEEQNRALKEAAEKEAKEEAKRNTVVSKEKSDGHQVNSSVQTSPVQSQGSGSNGMNSQPTGEIVRIAESARILEQRRLQKLKELDDQNQFLMSNPNMNFGNLERHIGRLIRQVRGNKDNVRAKAAELINILMNPSCPRSFVAIFAKKVVSHAENLDNTAFACGHVIVHVTSKVPDAMEAILAELHRACIYTVPKHIVYSKSKFASREAYFKAIGYREDDGKMEKTQDYLSRLESYMRFYGALVQTEVPGIQNPHGPKEGWAWLARFLNSLPANQYTAVALNAFLQTAGFVLFQKYKSQFSKVLNIILNVFLKSLKEREDQQLKLIISHIQSYIEDSMFLVQPDGRTLQGTLLSQAIVVQSESRPYYY